jgi:predicted PurR-regulated permease PerM
MDQRKSQHAWFLVLLGLVTLAFLWLTLDFIQPVFWAAVAAIIFDPLQRRLDVLLRGRRNLSALLTLVIIVLVVFIPLTLVAVAVSREALNLFNRIQDGTIDLPGMLQRVDPIARDLVARAGIEPESVEKRISEAAGAAAQYVASQAVVVGQNVLSVLVQTGLMLYLLFFFLRDSESLVARLADAIPLGESRLRTLFTRFTTVTRATLKGTLLVGAAQGTLGGLLFLILGIGAPVFWGVIMTVLSLVPLVGAAFVWVPAAVILMLSGSVVKGLILVAGGVLVVGTADNILRPLLVGRETRMPDYIVLLSTLGGLSVFGPAGFVAGPVLAALFLSVWEMFAREQRAIVMPSEAPPPLQQP